MNLILCSLFSWTCSSNHNNHTDYCRQDCPEAPIWKKQRQWPQDAFVNFVRQVLHFLPVVFDIVAGLFGVVKTHGVPSQKFAMDKHLLSVLPQKNKKKKLVNSSSHLGEKRKEKENHLFSQGKSKGLKRYFDLRWFYSGFKSWTRYSAVHKTPGFERRTLSLSLPKMNQDVGVSTATVVPFIADDRVHVALWDQLWCVSSKTFLQK